MCTVVWLLKNDMFETNFSQACSDSRLVTLINKVFHDVEADLYMDRHPEIYEYEAVQWRMLFKQQLQEYKKQQSDAITLLDIGSGLGFVPNAISPLFTDTDTIIFSDISTGMLKKAEELFMHAPFKKNFLNVHGASYDEVKSVSVDFVTLNSVLHHVPNIKALFSEIDRVLKPGGILIIKHEPNIRFSKSFVLRTLYSLLLKIRLKRSTLRRRQSVGSSESSSILTNVVQILKEKEGLVFRPELSLNQLQAIVDIHSPTALGGMDMTRGFDPTTMQKVYFPSYQVLVMQTYGYFGKIRDNRNQIRNLSSALLKTLFPNRGYFFEIVLKKHI